MFRLSHLKGGAASTVTSATMAASSTSDSPTFFKCKDCGIYFATYDAATAHTCAKEHPTLAIPSETEKNKTMFMCEECYGYFSDMKVFRQHVCAKEGEDKNGLKDKEQDLQNKRECVACTEEEANCVLCDCGHMVLCMTCSTKVNVCPICRADIKQKIKVFM